MATELGERVRVIKIDIDQNPELANRFQIQGVPTLMIFKNGEEKYKRAGVHSKPQLLDVLLIIYNDENKNPNFDDCNIYICNINSRTANQTCQFYRSKYYASKRQEMDSA